MIENLTISTALFIFSTTIYALECFLKTYICIYGYMAPASLSLDAYNKKVEKIEFLLLFWMLLFCSETLLTGVNNLYLMLQVLQWVLLTSQFVKWTCLFFRCSIIFGLQFDNFRLCKRISFLIGHQYDIGEAIKSQIYNRMVKEPSKSPQKEKID